MTNEKQRGAPHKVDELFYAALNRPPTERRSFLLEACGDDTELLAEVESLISAHDQAGGFLENPAVELVAGSLAEGPTLLKRGQPVGPYMIVGSLGMGGMGEVYRARDTRLQRTVAIKVLPSHLSADPERRQRFEREARAISRINHPHICTLYDIGKQNGVDFLVMEYVKGVTLAERLKKGSMTLDQALRVALEIADALDRAHNEGLVHRDVKPGNIMLTKSGAKLLDFGLAKLRDARHGDPLASSRADDSLTAPGTLLGTFQYMAPEQLQGKEVDARSDIFSLGAVLYEMVTRKKAFEAKSQASLIAAILEHEPSPLADSRPECPPLLDQVLRRCLTKEPEERWQTVKDMARTLKWIDTGAAAGSPARAPRFTLARILLPWFVTVAAVVVALVIGITYSPKNPSEPLALRFAVPLPEGASPGTIPSLALSPDGHLGFVAHKREGGKVSGKPVLWVRSPESLAWRDLPGTDGVMYPSWSPDSRSIGFFARSSRESGSPKVLLRPCAMSSREWRHVEPRRRDPVRHELKQLPLSGSRGGGNANSRHRARQVPAGRFTSSAALFARWPSLLVLRAQRGKRNSRNLCRVSRLAAKEARAWIGPSRMLRTTGLSARRATGRRTGHSLLTLR